MLYTLFNENNIKVVEPKNLPDFMRNIRLKNDATV